MSLANQVQGRIARVFAFSLLLKLVTFGLGIVLTRAMLPQHKGLSFTFEVYSATIGFLSKEAVRCTAARVKFDPSDIQTIRQVASISLMSVMLGVFISTIAMGLLLKTTSAEVLAALTESVPFSITGILLFFLTGQLVDLGSEVFQSIMRVTMDLRGKAKVEACCFTAKLMVTLALVEVDPAMAIGIGWLVYGCTALGGSYATLYWSTLPKEIDSLPEGDDKTRAIAFRTLRSHGGLQLSVGQSIKEVKGELALFYSFFSASALRLVLTEGEKFVLNSFAPLEEQGIFEVVSSLGSLVARIIFRVWEDAIFLAVSANTTTQLPWVERKQLLKRMLQWSEYLGILFVVCGPPNAKTFLTILYSSQWGTDIAANVLGWYCYYVPLIGINGIMEAYVRGSASTADFAVVRRSMVGSSVLYLFACYLALEVFQEGASGVILASCTSMLFRIGVSFWVIKRGGKTSSWRDILDVLSLPLPICVAAAATFAGTRWVAASVSTGNHKWVTILNFGVAPIFLIFVILVSDPDGRRLIRRRRGIQE